MPEPVSIKNSSQKRVRRIIHVITNGVNSEEEKKPYRIYIVELPLARFEHDNLQIIQNSYRF